MQKRPYIGKIKDSDVVFGESDGRLPGGLPARKEYPKWVLQTEASLKAEELMKRHTSEKGRQASLERASTKLNEMTFTNESNKSGASMKTSIRVGVPGGKQLDYKDLLRVLFRWYGSSFRAAHNSKM